MLGDAIAPGKNRTIGATKLGDQLGCLLQIVNAGQCEAIRGLVQGEQGALVQSRAEM